MVNGMAKTKKQNIVLEFNYPSRVFNKKYYDRLHDFSKFTEVHYGGASSGKSHGVVQKVVFKACLPWKHPRKVLFTRKVGRSIKDSIFEDVKSCLADWNLLPHCKINNTDFRITLPNGAEFLFKGMDDPEKIKSIKGISDVVMEEATEFTLEDYTQLTLRLREKKHKQRQIFLMFNPVSKLNWVFKYFFSEEANVDFERTAIYQSTYLDNKFLDEDNRKVIEDLANRNPAYYRIYALGEFATLDKLIFPKYTKKRLITEKLKDLPSFFGLDFGFNDPAAFIHIKVDEKNKKLYFLDEMVQRGLLSDSLFRKIDEMGFRKEVITADCSRPETIGELQKLGATRVRASKKGKDSVIQGIQYLMQFELIVDERCVKLIEELENYTWQKDKKTGEYLDKPVDSYNHVIDAARYAVEHLSQKQNKLAFIKY